MSNMLAVMFDCSRNGVMKVETVKKYADIIKKMGYNTLMLYIEDTYEIDGHPYFGHLRGRYSKEELKEMDKYCVEIGIELVPCIQTLAHLEGIFKWWDEYHEINDCEAILMVDNEKTYKLIEGMLATISECFTSKKVHIGMDEANFVGLGQYKKNHSFEDRFDIINRHLHKVCDLANKYDLESMIWSDMFCTLALDVDNQYDIVDASKIKEKAKLPDNVSLVYWDYYSTDYNRYVKMIKTNKMFDRKVYFAGGAWAWKGIAPDNDFSIKTTKAALDACRDMDVKDVIITMWGDDGNECPKAALLPSLMYTAEVYNGNDDLESIKTKFKDITGYNFDDFMLLDKIDWPNDERDETSFGKVFLYNDVFMGINDFKCKNEHSAYYKELAEKISSVAENGEYSWLFKIYEGLSKVLEIKATLGIRIREAYHKNDKESLKVIIKDMAEVEKRIDLFHNAYQTGWFYENKPYGFEVMDIRLGGLIKRIDSCKTRLEQYVNGKVLELPELSEPVLNMSNGGMWGRLVTPNRITMYL